MTTAFAEGHHGGSQSGYNTSSSSWMNSTSLNTSAAITNLASTVPSNGDVNPYGVAVVSKSIGGLYRNDVLVSNYNNKANNNGSGSTIVEINPTTHQSWTFANLNTSKVRASCGGAVGLTDALSVLSDGWVVVGSMPATNGDPTTLKSGCLIVLNSLGHVKAIIAGHGINGPWGMTALDRGSFVELFVTNALNGTVAGNGNWVHQGTVTRIDLAVSRFQLPQVLSITTIASHLPTRIDKAAFLLAQTGLALVGNTLFVVDTGQSRVFAIPNATTRWNSDGTGVTIAKGGLLSAPVAIAVLHNGVLIVTNGNNGNLIALTTRGQTAIIKALDTTVAAAGATPGAGALFGIATSLDGTSAFYVNDITSTLSWLGSLVGTGATTPTTTSSTTTSTTPVPTATTSAPVTTPTTTSSTTPPSGINNFTGHY
jgi:hypothetical protein